MNLSALSTLLERQQARAQNLRSALRSAHRHYQSLERLTDGHYLALSDFRTDTARRLESVREVQLPELPPCQGVQKPVQTVSNALPERSKAAA